MKIKKTVKHKTSGRGGFPSVEVTVRYHFEGGAKNGYKTFEAAEKAAAKMVKRKANPVKAAPGYATKEQLVQYSMLERATAAEMRSWRNWSYSISCRTCHESHEFGAPESATRFLSQHEGHKTWLDIIK